MTLTESQKKRLSDLAVGRTITSKISIDDQIAAIRKQLILLSEAAKVPLDADFKVLENLVAAEKAKKIEVPKPAKKTTRKSKN